LNRRNNTVEGKRNCTKLPKGSNDEVVITKLNKPGLEPPRAKGGYVSGNNTKEVVEYIKRP
jgi:Ca-activated chloride channel family protein